MDLVALRLQEVWLAVAEVMESKGLGGSGSDFGVKTGRLDIGRPWSGTKPLSPSIGEDVRDNRLSSNAAEPNLWNIASDAEYLLSNGQASGFVGTSAIEDFDFATSKISVSQVSGAKQLNRRSRKVGRSNSSTSRSSRIVQMEVSMNETGVEDVNEKPQIARQKSIAYGKQRDKRNGRLPKGRSDPFSLKNGLSSFCSVAGGGNLLAYGSKSNNFDVTHHVDELPFEELLDGNYTSHSSAKVKGKAVPNLDDNLLDSFRKACSILRLQSPVRTQNMDEIDHSFDEKALTCPITGGASPESRNNGGSGACSTVNQPSIDKGPNGRTKVLSTVDDSPLYEPKDILQRLKLPPPKELDSLLVDAVKPASSSKNNTDRLGKTASHRTGLPPFSWSFNSYGHSKSGPDAVKLAANRPSCQGRWFKVENTLTSPKDSTAGFLGDFESLTFDHRLVPVVNQLSGTSEKKNAASLVSCELVASSSAACPDSETPLAEHSSGVWAAAEALYEIASHSFKEDPHNILEGLEKSQKPMNASKLKLDEKSGRLVAAPAPSMGSQDLLKNPDRTFPSKRLKVSAAGHGERVHHTKPAMKLPIDCSAPRSIRSTGKLSRDSIPQTKHVHTSLLKKSHMMPPPSRIMDKGSQLKLKEALPKESNSRAGELN